MNIARLVVLCKDKSASRQLGAITPMLICGRLAKLGDRSCLTP